MKLISTCALLAIPTILYAATPIDLAKSIPENFLKKSLSPTTKDGFKETARTYDINQTMHLRFQQRYSGYEVWGADGVLHYPTNNKQVNSVSGNGTVYKNLQDDLAVLPQKLTDISYKEQAEKVILDKLSNKNDKQPDEKSSEIIVYLDSKHKAHWAYLYTFYISAQASKPPAALSFIIDAITFEIYKEWNSIKTQEEIVFSSGYGGNPNTGKATYDGLKDHLPALRITRDANKHMCTLKNEDFIVSSLRTPDREVAFFCLNKDVNHNSTYWHEEEPLNGAYSRSNDVLYTANLVQKMYRDWYKMEVAGGEEKKTLLPLVGFVNEDMENAYFDSRHLIFSFGNGGKRYYPFTSLEVIAHELSHAIIYFTSHLKDYDQPAGINEAFCDMAAKATSYYAQRPITWDIGTDVSKKKEPFRYMDKPSKDCKGWPTGWLCSIDRADQYGTFGFLMDEHHLAGVYNRFFYLLSHSPKWNIKKAFDVMVQATRYYWTSDVTYQQAACGVVRATKDLAMKDPTYTISEVHGAFREVGIETYDCT